MKSAQETSIEKMKAYAEEKYDQTFRTVEFVPAPDETYNEILALTDENGFVVNINHSLEDKEFTGLWDDYTEELIDEKLLEQMENDGVLPIPGAQANVRFRLTGFGGLSLDKLQNMSIEELLRECVLLKVTLFIKLDNNKTSISEQQDRLFDAYRYLQEMNPKHIGMEVIFASAEDEELANCIDNPRLNFKKAWTEYSSVTGYLSLVDQAPADAAALTALYQEVR